MLWVFKVTISKDQDPVSNSGIIASLLPGSLEINHPRPRQAICLVVNNIIQKQSWPVPEAPPREAELQQVEAEKKNTINEELPQYDENIIVNNGQ